MIKLVEREPSEYCQGYALECLIEGQKYESKRMHKFDKAFRKHARPIIHLMTQDINSKENAKYRYFYAPVFTIDMSKYGKTIRIKLDSYVDKHGAGFNRIARVWEIEAQVFDYGAGEKLSTFTIRGMDVYKVVIGFVDWINDMRSE